LIAPSVNAESAGSTVFGVSVGDIQSDIALGDSDIFDGAFTGTLKYLDGDNAIVNQWGAGNFIVLKFSADDWGDYTSVKVGLNPSEGSGLVDILNDPDKNGVFKITNKTNQRFQIVATNGTQTVTKTYSLSNLTTLDS